MTSIFDALLSEDRRSTTTTQSLHLFMNFTDLSLISSFTALSCFCSCKYIAQLQGIQHFVLFLAEFNPLGRTDISALSFLLQSSSLLAVWWKLQEGLGIWQLAEVNISSTFLLFTTNLLRTPPRRHLSHGRNLKFESKKTLRVLLQHSFSYLHN